MRSEAKLGGMLLYGIPSYRLPRERLQEDVDVILSTGVVAKRIRPLVVKMGRSPCRIYGNSMMRIFP